MIPLILKTIANNISSIINWFKGNFNKIAVIIISIFIAIFCLLKNQLDKKNAEIERLNNNIEYYLSENESNINERRVLILKVKELKNSKDSVIANLNNIKKELKIKDKELNLALSQKQEIKLDTTIIVNKNDFKLLIKPNSLTSLLIEKKDSILTAKLDIYNLQTLFISSKKQYKNHYKNWFCRLFNFDFKKKTINKYDIVNSNDLIKVTNTRVIQITK